MTPFLRLGLLFATTVYGLGLVLLYLWRGWAVAWTVAAIGAVLAVLVTVELAPRSPAASAEERAAGEPGATEDFTIRRRDRREIEQAADQARAE